MDGNDDPISFTRRFRCFIKSQLESNQIADQYLNEFKRDFVLTDDEKIDKCQKFMYGIYLKEGDRKYQTQTSLIMCLFAIDCLKDELAKILLASMRDYVMEKGESASPLIISLILTQFKFSDQLLNNETYEFMFQELFSILTEVKSEDCREAIIQYFRELDVSKQEEAGQRLYLMYDQKSSDLLRYIDILGDMSLDQETATLIFYTIQEYTENDCSVEFYPAMLKYSQYYSQSQDEIVIMLRDRIKWKSTSMTKKIVEDIFQLIDKSFKRDNTKIIESWIKTISSVNNRDDLR